MPEKTLERLSGRIKASLWCGQTHMVITERLPQKATGPYSVPLTHVELRKIFTHNHKVKTLSLPSPPTLLHMLNSLFEDV